MHIAGSLCIENKRCNSAEVHMK